MTTSWLTIQKAIVPVSYSHASAPVTTSAYTVIIAATSAAVTTLYVSDTSGSSLVVAFGGSSLEVNQICLSPGFADWLPLRVPEGTRISIKALDSDTASGMFLISGFSGV